VWMQFRKIVVRLLVGMTFLSLISCSSNSYEPIATYEPDTTSPKGTGEAVTYEPNANVTEESP
jgi:hypothetical protein